MEALPWSILTSSHVPPQFDVIYQCEEHAVLYLLKIIDEAIQREVLL